MGSGVRKDEVTLGLTAGRVEEIHLRSTMGVGIVQYARPCQLTCVDIFREVAVVIESKLRQCTFIRIPDGTDDEILLPIAPRNNATI